MAKEKERYIIQSVAKALELLNTLADSEASELGLVEISELMDSNPSSTFRLLATLETYNYVEQNPDNRKYHLGLMCLRLGNIVLDQNDIREQAIPVLSALRDQFKETVHLARLLDTEVVYIEKLVSLLPIGILGTQPGERAPAHCTALGKVMLAYQPQDQVRQLYADKTLSQRTPHTITSIDQLIADLGKIRARGYALDCQEHDLGIKCVAIPIWGHNRHVIAAISISGPVERINGLIAERDLIPTLKESGQEVSARVGAYQAPNPTP
jgi:DNA-binding IclR family transcriptional regulator